MDIRNDIVNKLAGVVDAAYHKAVDDRKMYVQGNIDLQWARNNFYNASARGTYILTLMDCGDGFVIDRRRSVIKLEKVEYTERDWNGKAIMNAVYYTQGLEEMASLILMNL